LIRYVAVGASETVGVGADHPRTQAWPTVFRRIALPRTSTYSNLGIPGITVRDALVLQVPRAVQLRPDLVTVWLNANDINAGVSVESYSADLQRLLRALRREGRARVLVANTPPLHRLPAYAGPPKVFGDGPESPEAAPETLEGKVLVFNRAIEEAAATHGAELVDLYGAAIALRERGIEAELVSADGFHPNTRGHRAAAEVFSSVLGPLSHEASTAGASLVDRLAALASDIRRRIL
jgi:acyl-CoA thioesterase I